ncbi:MAG: hypothetical protein KGH63_00405 [Candidatus Micrarchaeota archaeon]|nr:hypothetical protein [Candidatus Micrarchaeota archaeon]
MMWLEASLASLLVLAALSLSLQAPTPAHPLLEFASYQQLDERAAALAEIQTRMPPVPGAANDAAISGVFAPSDAYCYRYYWSGQSGNADFSSDACQSAFALSAPSILRSVRRGAWKDGQLQWLTVEQFEKP